MKQWLHLISGLCLMAGSTLVAQEVPPLLEKAAVASTASAERSTLNRTTGVLTSSVEVVAVNLSGRRIKGPVHAVVSFRTSDGVPVRAGITVPGSQGGFGQAPWQLPYFDMTLQLGADGWQPGEALSLPLTFSRDRSLQVLYEVGFAGRPNRDPIVDPGGPYAGQVGAPIVFSGAAEDPDGDPLTFAWDFGDSTGAATAQAEHAFATAGVKALKLTVDDGNGGVVVRDVTALVIPSGQFALAHTRVVEANGHPFPRALVTETGPQGSREFPGEDSGFVSLGAGAGDYRWKFSAPGHRPVWRKSTLAEGDLKLLPGPWLAPLAAPAELSVLEAVTLTNITAPGAAAGSVRLVFPAGAFTQPGTARLTALGPQALPFPLGFGWSPLVAFHLDLPELPVTGAAARLRLTDRIAGDELVTLVQFDETALEWKVVAHQPGNAAAPDELTFTLTSGGTWAALVRDTGTGAPELPDPGETLVPGTPQNLLAGVSAISSALPLERAASLDPDGVTGEGEAVFTPASGILPSGSWFRLGVQETYDLSDGTGLRTPDYDTTVYAYRRPAGRSVAAGVPLESAANSTGGTVSRSQLLTGALPRVAKATGEGRPAARFPLRPRLLFSPSDLKEAKVHVDVLPPLGSGASVLSREGGVLESGGIRVTVPPDALGAFAAGSLRSLDPGGFAGLTPSGFSIAGVFELNLSGLAPGAVLEFGLTRPVTPATDFMLARLVSFSGGSGLAPVQRLRSDAAGILTNAEPSTPPRLPGLDGPGQYLLIQLPAVQGLVQGIVRNSSGDPVAGIGVRIAGQSWLGVTGPEGRYFMASPAGPGTVLASNANTGDGAAADFTMPTGVTAQTVDLTLGALAPRILATTPAEGATKVKAVTPITITFSEPLDPASFAPGAITVTNPLGVLVVGSISLNHAATEGSFLPQNPLEHAATYTVALAATIKDRQGLPLEGKRSFSFAIIPFFERPAGAQLVIYEPGADNIPEAVRSRLVGYSSAAGSSHVVAHGSPGTADPEVPVILVNQNTGTTATVLSRPDGSFANFIDAEAEDFIDAVFVNGNGSRITVAATRQLFDDGRVGLFNTGGILEAESDGGPVQIIVAPGAIPNRSVFQFSIMDSAALLTLLGGVEPEGDGKILTGVHLDITGDPLRESVDVSVPIDPATLPIPPGGDPADATFALTRPIEVEGQKLFEIVDKMEFADGKLSTASPPFLGPTSGGDYLITLMTYMINGGRSVCAGHVVAVAGGSLGHGPEQRVPGAVVYVDSLAADGTAAGAPAPLGNGRIVCVADDKGQFRLLVPLPSAFAGAIRLGAVSNRFPGLLGTGFAPVISGGGLLATPGVVYFNSSTPIVVLTGLDISSPSITFAEPGRGLAITGQTIPMRFLATDNSSTPTLNVQLLSFDPVPGDPPILPEQFTFNAGTPASSGLNTRRDATLTTQRQGMVTLRATATDGLGNPPTVNDYVFFIRDNQVLLDFSDSRGPYVLSSAPQEGALAVDRFLPIQVLFNEPIDTSVPADLISGFRIFPAAGQPYISFSEDQRAFSLSFPGLRADTLYSLDFQPSFIRDVIGNPLDQDNIPDGLLTHYTAGFKTAREGSASVQVQSGGGVVENDNNFYFIDRGLSGLMKIIRKTPQDPIARLLATEPLLDFPRDLHFVENYSYRVPVAGGPPEIRRDRDLLVITGGLVGGVTVEGFSGLGPWMQVFDVTNPANPEGVVLKIISDSPSATFVKLDWSPPILSVLEMNGSETAIHYVDLALFIWANHRSHNPIGDPLNGFRGVDINGDGDYADLGELFPAPKSEAPAVGLINAGLVATFLPTPGAGRFTDFDMQFGGRFLGVSGSGLRGGGGYYQTLVDGGVLFTAANAFNSVEPVAGFPKRVLTLFGVPLAAATGGARLANLALVSEGAHLAVIDITDVLAPNLLVTLDLTQVSGGSLGLAQSAILRSDGLVALSCTSGQLILDPKRFTLPAQTGSPPPAVLGVRPGIGAGTRAFVSRDDLFAINQGTNALLSADAVDDIPLLVTGIFAEDINNAAPPPSFPPPGFVTPLPVIRRSKFATAPDAAAPNQLLEITDSLLPGQDPVLRLTAQIQPTAASFQTAFPEWKLNGVPVARGPRVEIAIPGYSNPGGAIFPSLLAILSAQEHTITCETKSLIVRVYPDIKSEDKVNLSALTQKLNAASKAVQAVVEAVAPPGLVSGDFKVEFPKTATFAFVNQWKECDDLNNAFSHKDFWTFDAEAGFDPLIGISGKVKIGPQIPLFKVKAVVFVEAYGQLTLKGKLSRDQCGNIGGCIPLTGKFGLKAGVELNPRIVEIVVEADAPISITAQICANMATKKVTSSFGATFDGLTGKVTVKAVGGIFEFPLEIQFIGGSPLIQNVESTLIQF